MAWVVFDRGVRLAERFGLDAPAGALEAGARRDPPRGLRAGLRRRAAHLHAVLRLPGARRERAEHPARRVPARAPTNASPERSTRSRASWVATASSRATRPPRPTTDCPAAKGSSSPARSGWSTPWRSTAASTRRAPCSSACSALANDLGLLAEEYDVERGRQVGNFPQAFSHLTLIGAAYAIAAAETDAQPTEWQARGPTHGGDDMKTVIVGGVAAGASTGARLRRLDESAEIVVLERDHYVSFANCGLPYHIGGAIPDRDSLLLQTPESLAKSLALDVRTGQEVLAHRPRRQGGRGARPRGGANVPGVLRQARALPGRRADSAADPGCRRPARRRAAQHPRHGPHHRPARRGRHERRRRRRQLHRAGAHRGLPGPRAADHRRRADRAADAVARPRDDTDPGLPRPHPRRRPPARHVGHGGSPRRGRPARARPLRRHARSRPTSW